MYSAVICMISCVFLVISLICVRSTKKWFRKQLKILERKKKELDELIYSATDMVHELNNVSDYVVTTVDEKSNELKEVMSEIDMKIEECKLLFEGKGKLTDLPREVVINKKVSNKSAEINELFEQGTDVADIAKELGLGKGEVQLILGMKEKIYEAV